MTTLMEMAHTGIVTKEIKSVAAKEGISADTVRKLLAQGLVVIPRNINSKSQHIGIGKMMQTKINANIGTSRDYVDICLLYTSDAADDLLCVDLGGRRII